MQSDEEALRAALEARDKQEVEARSASDEFPAGEVVTLDEARMKRHRDILRSYTTVTKDQSASMQIKCECGSVWFDAAVTFEMVDGFPRVTSFTAGVCHDCGKAR